MTIHSVLVDGLKKVEAQRLDLVERSEEMQTLALVEKSGELEVDQVYGEESVVQVIAKAAVKFGASECDKKNRA